MCGEPAALKDVGFGRPVLLNCQLTFADEIDGTGNDLALNLDYATKEPGAYPVILVTYEIVCSKGLDADKTKLVKSFLTHFASSDFQSKLPDIGYAPLPDSVRTKVTAAIEAIS